MAQTSWSVQKQEKWSEIEDLVGESKLWPFFIKKLFLKKNLNHDERRYICAFVWVNGLNPLIFFEWCELNGSLRDPSAWRHVKYHFYTYFPSKQDITCPEETKKLMYSYCVHQNQYRYINGYVRYYTNRTLRRNLKRVSNFNLFFLLIHMIVIYLIGR